MFTAQRYEKTRKVFHLSPLRRYMISYDFLQSPPDFTTDPILRLIRTAPRQRSDMVGSAPAKQKKRETLVPLFSTQSRGRTGTGVNLLVFETSASTDSAIWASDFSDLVCKCSDYFLSCKIFALFFCIF